MKKIFRESLGYIGFASVAYGISEFSIPVACIICGSFMFWLSLPGKTK